MRLPVISFCFLFTIAMGVVVFVLPVEAQLLNPGAVSDIKAGAGAVVQDTNPDSAPDPRIIAFFVIQVFLSILGTLFLGLTLISGYWYLTARGQEEKITHAQDTMRRAIIGLAVIFISFAIVRFALLNIQGAIDQGQDFYNERQYVNNETNDQGFSILP